MELVKIKDNIKIKDMENWFGDGYGDGEVLKVFIKIKKEKANLVVTSRDSDGTIQVSVEDKERYDLYDYYWIKQEWVTELKTEPKEEKTSESDLSNNIKKLTEVLNDNTHNDKLEKAIIKLNDNLTKESPFEKAMKEAIIDKGKEIAVKDIEDKLKKDLNDFIEKTYGCLPKKFEIVKDTEKKDITGIFHKEFENICKIVSNNIPLMLVGGAGAGKNHTLEQVAEALNLDFYFTNAVNQEYKLTGFIDANGTYHETQFYKAFTQGGMFFLDEMDASSPEALVILNSAIANKYFDFPTGRVNAHENFRVVAAANTYGTGADMVYVGRNVLDGATLDRFVVVNFDYDADVEKQLAYDNELYEFVKNLRNVIEEANLRYIVSMRAIINATKLLKCGMDKKMILETTIIKNMQVDDFNTIIKKLNMNNEWARSLKEMSDINV